MVKEKYEYDSYGGAGVEGDGGDIPLRKDSEMQESVMTYQVASKHRVYG